jgi:hypothetical protein
MPLFYIGAINRNDQRAWHIPAFKCQHKGGDHDGLLKSPEAPRPIGNGKVG